MADESTDPTSPGTVGEIDFEALYRLAAEQFRLGEDSIHGPWHWRRVEANGLMLAERSGADVTVVRLFAVLHDSRRHDEGRDREHGRRAADYAAGLRGTHFELDDRRLATLYDACVGHDQGRVTGEPTVGTCWDADRLDLVRLGLVPRASFMSTARGRELASARQAGNQKSERRRNEE